MNLLLFLGGLTLLVIGADILVRGASKLAMSVGISPLVVGLTIVAFGTSAPEVAVSVGAILDHLGRGIDDVLRRCIFEDRDLRMLPLLLSGRLGRQ